jgi:phosphoglycerate dehydrogenase-like enzyme
MSVVVASSDPAVVPEVLRSVLVDIEVVTLELTGEPSPHDLEVLARTEVIVPARGVVSREVMRSAPGCRLVQQFGAGLDGVDLEAARELGIPVCNVPADVGGNADSVAELAVMHLIAAGRSLRQVQRAIERGELTSLAPGRTLSGSTVCIVGMGAIGRAVARRLAPFDCTVIGIRRTPDPSDANVWPPSRLREALGRADFVVVALPLTAQTRSFIGAAEFDALKDGAFFVNVARGDVVDRTAFFDALRSGRVAAAGLDVFWHEPLAATDPVLSLNVVATPHIAGVTTSMLAETARVVAGNIARALGGEQPRYQVA